MRRIVILTLSVWGALFASIVVFAFFWRVEHYRPHPLWGILSLVLMFTPATWLAISTSRRILCGPCRWRAVGWLLIGATPLVWTGAYLTELVIDIRTRARRSLDAPTRVAGVWASSIMEIEARRRYARWTRGRHVVLLDDGQTPSAEKLVAEMDHHIRAMADLLGQPVPSTEILWVRGPLFGVRGGAIYYWSICAHEDAPDELTHLDRHEVAHSLITAISGPDQYPPRLLAEGWAEFQSSDRNGQIRYLAEGHEEGRTCSLQDLVGFDMYGEGGPAYSEGGPVVHYLIERYGPKVFFRLYSGVRRDSFHDDCRVILGDSWETVEEDFWKWLEAEDALLAESDVYQPNAAPVGDVELAQSVDPADWQALVEGYREANKGFEPLPSSTAFVIEIERSDSGVKAPESANHTAHEARAVFEGQQFWIVENCPSVSGRILMATTARCADLGRNDSGSYMGQVKPGGAHFAVRQSASEFLEFYRREVDPASLLPLRETASVDTICHIERVVRPADGRAGRWSVGFTRRRSEHDAETHYQVELDPGQRWWITHVLGERAGEWRSETRAESERIGDAFMPVTYHTRVTGDQGETSARWRARRMADGERQALKRRVDRAARSGQRVPYPWLRRFLVVIVITCPLGGMALLGITKRCVSSARMPCPAPPRTEQRH
jgi:hypothetical protein